MKKRFSLAFILFCYVCASIGVQASANSNAMNFNSLANTDDEYFSKLSNYDVVNIDLPLPYEGNTGSNMTVFLSQDFISSLPITTSETYFVALTSEGTVIGSVVVSDISQVSISVWADDTTTPEVDGAAAGETIVFQLVDGTDLYNVEMPTTVSYTTNDIVPQVSAASYTLVESEILGCTDSNANNYDSSATDDDESCEYPEVFGCTDSTACNYDASAIDEDNKCVFAESNKDCNGNCINDFDTDGTCDEDEVSGCVDSNANNYDSSATEDDGSCVFLGCMEESACNYNESATESDDYCFYAGDCQTCTGEQDGTGTVVESIPDNQSSTLCDEVYTEAEQGSFSSGYTMNFSTVGSDVTITCELLDDVDGVIAYLWGMNPNFSETNVDRISDKKFSKTLANQSQGSALTYAFKFAWAAGGLAVTKYFDYTVGDVFCGSAPVCQNQTVPGCNDVNACNYDSASNANDGSCIFGGPIKDCSGVCLNDKDGDAVCNEEEIFGCQDVSACNFNNAATDPDECVYSTDLNTCSSCSGEQDGTGVIVDNDSDDDGVCDADEISGCTDDTACNFDQRSTTDTDDTTCEYPTGCDTCSGDQGGIGTIVDNDSDGDGVCDADEISGCTDDTACNFDHRPTTDTDDTICEYPMGCDTCSGEQDGTGVIVDNDSDNDTVCDEDEILGCNIPDAENYNPQVTEEDDSCVFEACSDTTACNYNASDSIFVNDDLCIFVDEDSCDSCSGNTDGTGTIVDNDLDDDGVCDANEIRGCTDDTACNYDQRPTTDTDNTTCEYPMGCETCSGEQDGTGVIVDNDSDNDGVCTIDEILGCQDELACNFNNAATDPDQCIYSTDLDTCASCSGEQDGTGSIVDNDSDNDGVCNADEILGCQDELACNFNSASTDPDECVYSTDTDACASCSGEQDGTGVIVDNDADDDGICDVDEIVGCQNEMACDYNESATDDGSCTYAEDGFDCEGNKFNACPNDLFVEYYSPALNYDENLCVTLIMLGCTDSTAYNFDSSANTDDLSCISKVYGCTDSTAYNYSEFVNTDDDSCIPVSEGCTNSDAQNYDVSANSDDGSCLIEGCMNATAENYNSDAGIDDGTCVIFGCTVQSACNFNMDATDDDQSCLIPSKCEICIGYLHYDSGTIKYDLKDDESGFCLNVTETEAKGIYIYPNPTDSYFSISDVNYQEIDIYSLTGQLMVHIDSYREEINISHLSNGIYTLMIMDVDGNLSYGKLIKK
jgi:hypothetical protein